jgi:ribose 5-phosphate isomerase A
MNSADQDPAAKADVVEYYKQQAAEHAVEFVRSSMVVGLGTGSTAIYATRRLAQLLQDGRLHDVVGTPTSRATAVAAGELGIPLLEDDLPREIDVTIDGADEVSPELHLIKGGGGALLREKIVAESSLLRVYVVDDSKLSTKLGVRKHLPVEVVKFGWLRQSAYLRGLGAEVTLRLHSDGTPFVTDQGNFILDCAFGPIDDPRGLAARIRRRSGIVEHGLFVGLTSELVVAGPDGVRRMRPKHPGLPG